MFRLIFFKNKRFRGEARGYRCTAKARQAKRHRTSVPFLLVDRLFLAFFGLCSLVLLHGGLGLYRFGFGILDGFLGLLGLDVLGLGLLDCCGFAIGGCGFLLGEEGEPVATLASLI